MCLVCIAYLATGFDSFHETAKANDPGEEEAESDVPLDFANVAGVGECVGKV